MTTTSLDSFNFLLKGFIEQLSLTFPEEKKLKLFARGFDPLVALSPEQPMEVFLRATQPHQALLMSRNPDLFDQNITLPGGISLSKLWQTPDLSDSTREAIWGYLTQLFIVANTYATLPAPLLQQVELIAQNCAAGLKDGETPDLAKLLPKLTAGLAPILQSALGGPESGGLGSADLAEALGGLFGAAGGGGGIASMLGMLSGGGGGGGGRGGVDDDEDSATASRALLTLGRQNSISKGFGEP